ncbi:hypothetical protein N781_04395 [Pontibacillus halophilus JSM 076056 = DSM 19796]|uniref:Cell division protein FtsK n=1 Tax=Pontibacillus halophilus JSM 076056 = DSM 19796 TaxID=1385510 RepID=A0A0A5I656_9BACI|nr:YpjP family protein [Pontibacillus halophilus]KGX91312.1 hypothetical protein N781_04395 [Pontibacillus halophilus JSM 076056 = DSM 19796]
MKRWMRKGFVALVAVMTLGMYVPSIDIDAKVADQGKIEKEDSFKTTPLHLKSTIPYEGGLDYSSDGDAYVSDPVQWMADQAKEQTITKLGPKIYQKVEDEMEEVILPRIEEVIQQLTVELGEDRTRYLEVAETPSAGYGERIFNVQDGRTEEVLAKFHVRRDNRPGEGYWFNFHYHSYKDQFEEHYVIGDVYWDKNTPPKWMTS